MRSVCVEDVIMASFVSGLCLCPFFGRADFTSVLFCIEICVCFA